MCVCIIGDPGDIMSVYGFDDRNPLILLFVGEFVHYAKLAWGFNNVSANRWYQIDHHARKPGGAGGEHAASRNPRNEALSL
jgi:hypothetical protein